MLPAYSMHQDVTFFLATVLCDAGQYLDARTTEVGLSSGFQEGNAIGSFLLKKLGVTGLYVLKCAALPAVAGIMYGFYGKAGIVADLVFAGLGFAAGIRNYLMLRKNKVSVF